MRNGRVKLSGNVDFGAACLEEVGTDRFHALDVTHSDRCSQGVSIRTGRGVAYRLAVAEDGFAAPENGFRVLKDERDELACEAGLFLFEEGFFAEEIFFPIDGKTEAGFERGVIG